MKCCFILLLFICLAPLTAQEADPYVGVFTHAESGVILSVQPSAGGYAGHLQYQGQRFPFTAVRSLGMLSGEYAYQGNQVPFTLARLLGVYYLTSEGVSLEMNRTPEQPGAAPPAVTTAPDPAASSVASTQAPAAAGARVSDPYGGYSFQLPAGWRHAGQDGGFALTNAAGQTEVVVNPHHYRSLDEIRANVFDVQDENTSLRSAIQAYGSSGFLIDYRGASQGQPLTIQVISLVSPHGGGVNITWSARRDKVAPEMTLALKSIANSVAFVKPQSSPLADQWKKRLAGRQLLYLHTYNGGSDKITIDLCANGQFQYYSNSGYSSGGYADFSYAGQGGDSGSWRIVARGNQPVLVLFYQNGSSGEFALSPRQAGNEVDLNGRRYFVVSSEACP